MKRLMWGKALAAIAKKTGTTYGEFKVLPEIVENSTSLTTTKGEKKEAKVEGGGVEAVRYSKNTYGLVLDIRRGKVGDEIITFPFEEVDGVVDGIYYLRVQPEDKVGDDGKEVETINWDPIPNLTAPLTADP